MTAPFADRLLPILGALAVMACTERESTPLEQADASAEVRDSAGVQIRVWNAGSMASTVWARLDSQPRFELGRSDEADEVFFQVRGMVFLNGGELAVLDGASSELRRFDSEGRRLESVGRKGDGPGEFDDPYLVSPGPSDSLWVWDAAARVLHRFDTDAWTVEVVRPQSWRGARAPLGVAGSHLLTESTPMSGFKDGTNEAVLTYRSFDLENGSETEIAQFVLPRLYRARVGAGGPPGITLIPFTDPPPAVVWAGHIAVASGPSVEIELSARSGGVREIYRFAGWPPQVVTPTMIDAARRAQFGESADEPGVVDLFEEMPIPDTLPGVDRLLVDGEDRLGVGLTQASEEAVKSWVLFERRGSLLGLVQTPAGFRLMAANGAAVAGVSRDDMDREIVQVFDLLPIEVP